MGAWLSQNKYELNGQVLWFKDNVFHNSSGLILFAHIIERILAKKERKLISKSKDVAPSEVLAIKVTSINQFTDSTEFPLSHEVVKILNEISSGNTSLHCKELLYIRVFLLYF